MTFILSGILALLAVAGWWQWANVADDLQRARNDLARMRKSKHLAIDSLDVKIREKDASIEVLLLERADLLSECDGLRACLEEYTTAQTVRLSGKVGRA